MFKAYSRSNYNYRAVTSTSPVREQVDVSSNKKDRSGSKYKGASLRRKDHVEAYQGSSSEYRSNYFIFLQMTHS